MRPTGGFIGGIGTIRIENGRITEVNLGETEQFRNNVVIEDGKWIEWVTPPLPFTRYQGKNHWHLHDAGWWADFPASARKARELWGVGNDTKINGVIGVTDQTVASLLQVIGPVKTASGEIVDADNVLEFATDRLYNSENDTGSVDRQTQLLQEMALVFVGLTQDMSIETTIKLAKFLQGAARQNEFLITSFDPPAAAVLHELGVDGAVLGKQDDYFYLVESNLSDTKISNVIQQDLFYEVELNAMAWPTQATLTVNETNNYSHQTRAIGFEEGQFRGGRWNAEFNYFERYEGYYGGYTRLYPPNKSEFTGVTGFNDGPNIDVENYRTVVGGYVGLFPDEQQQLQFKWVPKGQPSEEGRYQLLVQRQPGAPEHALNVVVKLPSGYKAVDITPSPLSVTDNQITWHSVLNQNRSFSLRLQGETSELSLATVETETELSATDALPVNSATQTEPRPIAPAPEPEPNRGPLPAWLSIPVIGVGAPVIPVGLEPSGIMASPQEADIAGWYELGPRPGEASNAIIAAHVDWQGREGAFSRLHELKPGDIVEVQSGPDISFTFIVESIETYQADTAPVAEVFGPTPGEPVLTLITCGGPYDHLRQEYRDRIVVRTRGKKEP